MNVEIYANRFLVTDDLFASFSHCLHRIASILMSWIKCSLKICYLICSNFINHMQKHSIFFHLKLIILVLLSVSMKNILIVLNIFLFFHESIKWFEFINVFIFKPSYHWLWSACSSEWQNSMCLYMHIRVGRTKSLVQFYNSRTLLVQIERYLTARLYAHILTLHCMVRTRIIETERDEKQMFSFTYTNSFK